MNKFKRFISHNDRAVIEGAVKKAEAKTSGEIVPAVVKASSDYGWIGYRGALLGWAAASLATMLYHSRHPFGLEFWAVYVAQALGLILGWTFSRSPLGLRLLVPASWLEHEVLEAAQSAFLRFGLTETRHRTGILIFVSLRERRVHILADKGIHEKLGNAFWKQEADRIAESIRAGKVAQGMAAAIENMGHHLEKHFPRQADDTNELPDHLRIER